MAEFRINKCYTILICIGSLIIIALSSWGCELLISLINATDMAAWLYWLLIFTIIALWIAVIIGIIYVASLLITIHILYNWEEIVKETKNFWRNCKKQLKLFISRIFPFVK